MSALRWAAIAVLALSPGVAAIGCSAAADDSAKGPLTVYVTAPLRGEHGAQGRDIADGARLALTDADGIAGEVDVELEILDAAGGAANSSGWSPAAVGRNARAAAQDSSAIAYVGDYESGATRISLPITNQAVVPQISPGSTALDLVVDAEDPGDPPHELQPSGERTFLRVIPDDGVQAEAGAAWAKELGARRVAAVSDGSAFGDRVTEEFVEAASAIGISVIERGGLPGRADLVYLGGTPRTGGLQGTIAGIGATAAGVPLMSSDAFLSEDTDIAGGSPLLVTASAQAPEQLPAAGQDFVAAFEEEYGRAPGPYAAYGYEATALVLDAIERAGDEAEDRRAVLDELLATSDRESVLGTYSITAVGNTTLEATAGYRIEGGEPIFDRALTPP